MGSMGVTPPCQGGECVCVSGVGVGGGREEAEGGKEEVEGWIKGAGARGSPAIFPDAKESGCGQDPISFAQTLDLLLR